MKQWIFFVVIGACVSAIAGCSSVGRPIYSHAVAQLKVGQTTRSDETISQSALTELGMKALSYKKADAFSPPFDDSTALYHTFRISVPLPHNTMSSINPAWNGGWSYDADKQQLYLTVEATGWIATHRPETTGDLHFSFTLIEGVEIKSVSKQLGSDVEQNSFGAQVVVQYGHLSSVGIAAISDKARAKSVVFNPTWNTLSTHIPMPAAEARRKVKGIVIVVEGRILPLDNGRASICGDDGAAATYSSPTSIVGRFCVFNAEIDRIAVESGRQVLAEWRAPHGR